MFIDLHSSGRPFIKRVPVPAGGRIVGTVKYKEMSGALVYLLDTGGYIQINNQCVIPLPRDEVQTALGAANERVDPYAKGKTSPTAIAAPGGAIGGRMRVVNIDDATHQKIKDHGNGNFSAGVRRLADLID